jgi:hypothetical protein
VISLTVRDWLRAPRRTTRYLTWRASRREPPRLERPIFIVGCPRSGTSIAVELFAAHADVANWSEAGRLWDPVDYSNPEADHCWEAGLATQARAARLHGWCEWYRESQGKARFVNKHPRNSVRIGFLDRVFPDALFIHVIRDGRAVASSMLQQIRSRPRRQHTPFGGFCKPPHWRKWLRDDEVEQTAIQWREIVRYVRGLGAALGTRYHEIRYEDFCEDPRERCRQLFEFAGLETSAARLPALPERLEIRNQGFRKVLTAPEIATIERTAGDLLSDLGY